MDIIETDYSPLLENPVYFEIITAIAGGYNYSTKLAKFLGKKQATVTEQLKYLEEEKLIIPEKRSLSQTYSVNWKIITTAFWEVIRQVIKKQHEYGNKNGIDLRKLNFKIIAPEELIKSFIKDYAIELASVQATPKPLSILVPAMFIAINNLSNKKLENLTVKFKLDKNMIKKLDEVMEFELSGVEWFVFNYHLT
ncbi:MAG: hypothetical protein BJBARM5_0625 [Candidatus Parvarchaeum acidophilus ARMAN-5]|jgi:DNA-binding MarR family transcriptional regulator|uniref:Uncharacterized protein n=1 Tax=Candidatus Parvarchaeum acidophilus ARMAN-5 TaxID=662762 RepID=D6GVV6_PARA5|nr:MAG: hypothetical protein BJBARM5_0625 [Candidatus Parvarchaeum acidophilus ARMAN-5]